MCWANLCENPKCNIKTHFKRESGLSDFEKLHKIKVPENFMLNHGSYVRYKDGNINRERWKEEFISWGEFLKRHANFCAANQGYYHVYKRYCATTKVPRNFFQNQTEFWFTFWDVVNSIVVLRLDFLEAGLFLGFWLLFFWCLGDHQGWGKSGSIQSCDRTSRLWAETETSIVEVSNPARESYSGIVLERKWGWLLKVNRRGGYLDLGSVYSPLP